MLIAVIGDCLLDISVRPSGPMRPGADAPAAIRLSPGGQGANVAVHLARRGARVRLITSLGDDTAGRILRDTMEEEGVELVAARSAATGRVVALLDRDGDRTMLSDRPGLDLSLAGESVRGAGWIHLSGYVLRQADSATLVAALAARQPHVRLSVAGGSAPAGDEAQRVASLFDAAQVELLVVDREEAHALSGIDGSPRTLAGALGRSRVAVVTAGPRGAAAAGPGIAALSIAAARRPGDVVDTTGAGDAFTAALLAELSGLGAWPPSREELRAALLAATELGARVVRVDGAQGRTSDG